VKEFIAYCHDNKGKVTYASSGNGTTLHLSGELFKRLANVEMTHIPYRGGALALNDLLPGRVDVSFDNMPSVIGHVRAGAVRALAVTTKERVSLVPDIPTIAESGRSRLRRLELVRLLPAGEDAEGDHRQSSTPTPTPHLATHRSNPASTNSAPPERHHPRQLAAFLQSEIANGAR
jgi:tripartite-type tricarboxylate transporter receptor subunit TctC